MKLTAIAVAASTVMLAAYTWVGASRGQGGIAERTIKAGRGQSIASRIRPTDNRVNVVLQTTPPLGVEAPPGVSHIQWLTQLSDAVIVAKVTRRDSHFSNDGSTVESNVEATITDVLKQDQSFSLRVGQALPIKETGGTVTVGQATVVVREPWREPLSLGGRYIFFVSFTAGHVPVIDLSSALEVTSGRVRSLARSSKFATEASSEAAVVASVEQASNDVVPTKKPLAISEADVAKSTLKTRVATTLSLSPDTKGADIVVRADEYAVVTLTGVVTSAAMEQKAVELATGVDGVQRVISQLTVK